MLCVESLHRWKRKNNNNEPVKYKERTYGQRKRKRRKKRENSDKNGFVTRYYGSNYEFIIVFVYLYTFNSCDRLLFFHKK